jgi:hypothetical protein
MLQALLPSEFCHILGRADLEPLAAPLDGVLRGILEDAAKPLTVAAKSRPGVETSRWGATEDQVNMQPRCPNGSITAAPKSRTKPAPARTIPPADKRQRGRTAGAEREPGADHLQPVIHVRHGHEAGLRRRAKAHIHGFHARGAFRIGQRVVRSSGNCENLKKSRKTGELLAAWMAGQARLCRK